MNILIHIIFILLSVSIEEFGRSGFAVLTDFLSFFFFWKVSWWQCVERPGERSLRSNGSIRRLFLSSRLEIRKVQRWEWAEVVRIKKVFKRKY